MKITTVGRGTIGGGLAGFWSEAEDRPDLLPVRGSRRALGAPQISVGPVEPVLSWGTEDVHIERRLERLCLMRYV